MKTTILVLGFTAGVLGVMYKDPLAIAGAVALLVIGFLKI